MTEVKVFSEMIYDDINYLLNVTRDESRMKDKAMIYITKSIFNRISIIANSAKVALERS